MSQPIIDREADMYSMYDAESPEFWDEYQEWLHSENKRNENEEDRPI